MENIYPDAFLLDVIIRKDVLNMCYKDEVQRRNTEKLQKKFDQDNTPGFIQKYFTFIFINVYIPDSDNI